MTTYQKKIASLKPILFPNQEQLVVVIRLRKFINEHYDQKVNLDLLSEEHSISKYHMLRLFKRYFGQTPRQYLIDKRLEKSKELLQTTISVTETCFTVGFESVGSFSSLFKNKTGKTPSQYQKEQLSRNSIPKES